MDDPERKRTQKAATNSEHKRSYEPPAVKWFESFDDEAMLAAACGKSNPSQGAPCAAAQTS